MSATTSNKPTTKERSKFTAEDILGVLDEGFLCVRDYVDMPILSDNRYVGISEVGKSPKWNVMYVHLSNGQLFEVRARQVSK